MNLPIGYDTGFMDNHSLSVLQVNALDTVGGAGKVAYSLFQSYRQKGYKSYLAVGNKTSDDKDVLQIPNDNLRSTWARIWLNLGYSSNFPSLKWIGQPYRCSKILIGREDFDFPGSNTFLSSRLEDLDILHCHNLHGGYFDLRILPHISHKVPVLITLHDAWMLTGHCAHFFSCERWMCGCGKCPDLKINPSIRHDSTAHNWMFKRNIYARSRLYITTPCSWLMSKVKSSMLTSAIVESKVIPNGVDRKIFNHSEKTLAREILGLPQRTKILLFAAAGLKENIWKDYETLRKAISLVAKSSYKKDILFIALGENSVPEKIGSARVQFIDYQKDPLIVARYYQSADIYIHAARADTFPNTILEALSCGTPVVATSVGGIPEQVDDFHTGFLVPQGDSTEMSHKILELLQDDCLTDKMGYNGSKVVNNKFNLDKQVNDYLCWYKDIIKKWC